MATLGETSRPAYVYDSGTDTWIPVGIGPHSHDPSAINAVASTTFDAKGDLLVGTGADTYSKLTVGTNGYILVADSAQSTGVKWAAQGNAFAFRAYRATNQVVSSATFTKIQLTSETFDTNNWFDSTTNYRFTPTIAGYYRINGTLNWSTGSRSIGIFYKNGAEKTRWADAYPAYAGSGSDIFYMNGSTDYLELYTYCTGAGLTVLGDEAWCTLSGEFIGA